MKENEEIIEVDLDNDLLLWVALEAHRRDMKLNDLFIEMITAKIEEDKDKIKGDDLESTDEVNKDDDNCI